MRKTIYCLLVLLSMSAFSLNAEEKIEQVVLETDEGTLEIELYLDRAPVSTNRFLAYLDNGAYVENGSFYRVAKKPSVDVLQGGLYGDAVTLLPPIEHESTRQTGIHHKAGVISLGRARDSQSDGSAFFICITDEPLLDFGGINTDSPGYAAFGKVIKGMGVVNRIHNMPSNAPFPDFAYRFLGKTPSDGPPPAQLLGQFLDRPVRILRAYRKADLSDGVATGVIQYR